MAKVTWAPGEKVRPPATFTLVLTEDEALAVHTLLDHNGEANVSDLRRDNPAVYDAMFALSNALLAAGVALKPAR